MAGWGVGLGAFAQGFAGGIGLGQKFSEANQKRQDRESLDKIKTEGKAAFDADVAAGKTSPDQWNQFFTGKILPQMQQEFAQRGDLRSAKEAGELAELESTRQGRSLFSQALMSAQSGDMDGALGTFGKLAAVPGYGPAGYTFSGTRKLADASGQPAGWAVDYRDGSGKQFSATFKSPDDFMNGLVSIYAPETRIKEMIETRRSARERDSALGLYKDKTAHDLQVETQKQQLGLTGVPQGFRWKQDHSGYEPIPGGPADPAYLGGKAQATQAPPPGFTQRPDGAGYAPVPGGPADPSYIGAKAKAETEAKTGPQNNPYAAGGAFNEGQGKAATFADRMAQADAVIGGLENINQGVSGWVGGMVNERLGDVAANQVASPDRQKVVQAQRNFINSILRRESGAVISDPEFSNARQQYFPQPGDSPEVIKQKRENRASAIRGLMREAGGSYKPPKGWEDPSSLPSYYAPKQAAAGGGGRAAAEPTDPATGQPVSSLPRPRTAQEYQSLPKGQRYVAPDGSVRVRQ